MLMCRMEGLGLASTTFGAGFPPAAVCNRVDCLCRAGAVAWPGGADGDTWRRGGVPVDHRKPAAAGAARLTAAAKVGAGRHPAHRLAQRARGVDDPARQHPERAERRSRGGVCVDAPQAAGSSRRPLKRETNPRWLASAAVGSGCVLCSASRPSFVDSLCPPSAYGFEVLGTCLAAHTGEAQFSRRTMASELHLFDIFGHVCCGSRMLYRSVKGSACTRTPQHVEGACPSILACWAFCFWHADFYPIPEVLLYTKRCSSHWKLDCRSIRMWPPALLRTAAMFSST